MSDENKENNLKNKAIGLGKKIATAPLAGVRLILKMISKLLRLIIWNPITIGAVMFIIGARMHETGQLAGVLGKDLRGASVTLSGACSVKGKPRVPALAEDHVKITYVDGEKIQGVVRKTRELVECKLSEIAIDKLPLLADFRKSPDAIPELGPVEMKEERIPEYKQLEQKTLLMSGSCVDLDGKTLPSFTDEKVDVTSVEASKEQEGLFVLQGIKKSDQKAIRCLSNAIKYEIAMPMVAKKDGYSGDGISDDATKRTYVGEMLLITGTCFPDERTRINKTKKYAFYKLANTRVQVLEEEFDKNEKLVKVLATIMDGEYLGDLVLCQKSKIPFIYKEYDPENTKFENKVNAEGSEVPAAPVAPAPVAPAPAAEGGI